MHYYRICVISLCIIGAGFTHSLQLTQIHSLKKNTFKKCYMVSWIIPSLHLWGVKVDICACQRCPLPNPWSRWNSYGQKDSADAIELMILRWGDGPGLSMCMQCYHKHPYKKEADESKWQQEGGRRGQRGERCWADGLGDREGGSGGQGMEASSRSRKRQWGLLPQGFLKGSGPVDLLQMFHLQNDKRINVVVC